MKIKSTSEHVFPTILKDLTTFRYMILVDHSQSWITGFRIFFLNKRDELKTPMITWMYTVCKSFNRKKFIKRSHKIKLMLPMYKVMNN